MPHCFQEVDGVPGEAADGFRQDDVDSSIFAVRNHPLEFRAVLGACAGNEAV